MVLNFLESTLPLGYWGLPLFSSRLKIQDWLSLIEILQRRLASCMALVLSFPSRIKLIKSTLSALHIYWASSFMVPKACINLTEKHNRNFICGAFEDKRKMQTISWSKICWPTDEGGLGLRSRKQTAEAARQKQIWFIVSNRKSLWNQWVHSKYFKSKSFWDLKNQTTRFLGLER